MTNYYWVYTPPRFWVLSIEKASTFFPDYNIAKIKNAYDINFQQLMKFVGEVKYPSKFGGKIVVL